MSNEISRGGRRVTPQSYGTGSSNAAGNTSQTRAVSRLNAMLERSGVSDRAPDTPIEGTTPRKTRDEIAAGTINGVAGVDLAPLNNVTSDYLVAQLTRIEHLIGLEAEGVSGADRQSFDIGMGMINETIRRLRLVQSAGDKFVPGGL